MRFRAFISVDIDPGPSLVGLLDDLRRSGADLKVVRPEQMHLTLKFLGDTDESLVRDIVTRMDRVLKGVAPFEVRLVGMGAFPSLSNIRVVWVGIEDGHALQAIAQGLDSSLNDLGFERDRKGFRAHLTIARTRSPRSIGVVQDMIGERGAAEYGTYRMEQVRLKRSVLSPQGPTYDTMAEVRLEDRGRPDVSGP